jgi:hypothetical protein
MLKEASRAFLRSGHLTLLGRYLKGSRSAIVLPSPFVVQQSLRVPSLMMIAWSVKVDSTLLLQSLISYELAFCKLVWKTGFPFFRRLLCAIASSPSQIMFDISRRPRRVPAAHEGIAWLQKRFERLDTNALRWTQYTNFAYLSAVADHLLVYSPIQGKTFCEFDAERTTLQRLSHKQEYAGHVIVLHRTSACWNGACNPIEARRATGGRHIRP